MLIIAWETTGACNLECRHCRASATGRAGGDELSEEEARYLIEEIAELHPMLILSGGEPLLRPDILSLAEHATSLGIRTSLATNGTLLSEELAERIASSGIRRVSVSLDGATQEVHDTIRGPGSFRAAERGMDCLKGILDLQINFTITRQNEHQVSEIFDLAEEKGARALHLFFLVPTGRGRQEDAVTAERQEALLALIEQERSWRGLEVQVTCAPQHALISGGRSGGCLAGRSFVFVSRCGDVYPCGYLPLSAGSIRERPFLEIWEGSPLLMVLRRRDLRGRCGACDHMQVCGGCRARAYASSGDFLGPDPQCSL